MRVSILRLKDVFVAKNKQIPEDQYAASTAPATSAVGRAVQSHLRPGYQVRRFWRGTKSNNTGWLQVPKCCKSWPIAE